MVKQRKHSSSKVSDFFDYLGGKLSGKERNAFERRLQKDPFEADAAEGLGMVTRAEMEEDLHAASAKIRRRIRRKRRIAWYSTAAAVASLMIVATIFFNVDDGSMDRYKTAPEYGEAVQEPPTAAGVEKERARKDAIPEKEELQEGLMLEEELVQEEELVLDEEKVLEDLMLEEELVQFKDKMLEELILEEELMLEDLMLEDLMLEEPSQKMNTKGVVDDENIVATGNENVVVAEKENVAAAAESNTGENAAGRIAISEKADGERQPDEVSAAGERPPDEVRVAGERQPDEVRAAGEMVEDEIVFVERAADATGSKPAARTIQEVPTAQKVRQDEIPDMEEMQPIEEHIQLDEVVLAGHATSKKVSTTGAVSRVETDPVTENVYITASPVDGIVVYRQYIDSTLVYPAETESSDNAVVVLKFSVTPGGRPENFRVIRSPGEVFSQEAIRVISEGPDWKPTTSNGIYVDDDVRLRVVFRTDK